MFFEIYAKIFSLFFGAESTEMKVMVLIKAASTVSFATPAPDSVVTFLFVTLTVAMSFSCMSISPITVTNAASTT